MKNYLFFQKKTPDVFDAVAFLALGNVCQVAIFLVYYLNNII